MYRNFCLKNLFFVFFCILWTSMQAQYFFDKLTEENGLSDNRVTSFLKDKTGFLWIGTRNGLNRYDGNTFKIFKPTAGNSISSEEITDIVQDSLGRIWVSTLNGLNIYDPGNNHWETLFHTGDEKAPGLPNYLVWDLLVDKKNRIWIVSDVWQLSIYDPATKKFTYYDWPSFKQQPQFDHFPRYRSIQKAEKKNENELWLATNIGLFSVNIQSGKFRFYGSGFNANIKDLKYDAENRNVYLVTEHGQVFCYDEKSGIYSEIKVTVQSYPAAYWEKGRDLQDKLQLAHNAGMLEISKTTKEVVIILHQPTLSSTILPGGTNIVYPDKDGVIWTGTNNGLSFFNSRDETIDFIPLSVASDKESADGMSAAFYDETEDKYFVASLSAKALFIIDRRTGKVTTVNTIEGKPLSACTNICIDRQNNIWLLTASNVYRYDRLKKSFHLFPTPELDKPSIFHDMLEDKKGDYWLAAWHGGLYQYKTKEKQFRLFTAKDGITARNITALGNDAIDDAIWIGSFGTGVYRYDIVTGKITRYYQNPANPEYMQLNLVRDLEADAAGKLWMATHGAGLYFYNHGRAYEHSFNQITAKEGLTHSSYYSIASDNKSRLWLLSGKGLSVVDSSGKFLYEVPKHPALSFASYAPDLLYPKRIAYNKSNDELLVPVAGGLLIYHPGKTIPPVNFPIVLTDIAVAGRSVIYDSAYTYKSKVKIPYKYNSLSFQFAALNYSGSKAIQYEYKLHGREATWKAIGISNTMNFPDLSPGDYTFMVRAKDAAGSLSSNTLSFSFRITPPFWKTWWFISLLVLLAGYGVYLWTVSLRRKLKSQKILNYFATSLYGQNTIDDIFWDIAKNCISQLKFVDCMVYLYDPQRRVLMQKAAYGPKNPEKHEIINAIEIPLGKGIVGAVAQNGKAEIVRDTSKDSRYIIDDERRYSEITVPILVDGKIFGIIDSEHPRKNFYRKHHLRILQDIAAVCSDKISKYIVEERLRSKISRDLHDEIGSALTSINLLSKVALNKAGNDAEINSYLSKIKDSTFSTMESMSDIVWAINPKNDKLEALMSRMKEFAADICEAQGIDLSFILPPELETLSIDLAKRKNLFLVFKEAVNNAVKYSGCTLLHAEFVRTHNQLRMIIKDNGKGFDKTAISHGNGLYNMQERVSECNGTLQIESGMQQGTSIILEIPITLFGVSAGT
jgi:signal transduction histidine kinase/ligand-binding sensor domain-containing protein